VSPAYEDNLPTAVLTAKEQDLKPLGEEALEVLELDRRQATALNDHLHEAWFAGVRMGHKALLEAKLEGADPTAAVFSMQDEFQDLMERLAETLNTTVGATIAAWDYLGRAWIAGARFWEIEFAARLIESQTGGLEEVLRRLQE